MCVNSLSQGLKVDLPKAGLEPLTSRSENRASATRPRRHTNLTDIYRGLPNFKRVVILGFWQGSIGVNYTVEFGALDEKNSTPVASVELKEKLVEAEEKLLKLPDVNQEHVKETFNKSVIKEPKPVSLKIEMTVQFDGFTTDLQNRAIELYRNISQEYTERLTNIYKSLSNFKRVNISGF
ncbi:hypothetical protein ElyMa_006452900, partial [Elysia marginata]